MAHDSLRIRAMTRPELEYAVAWAAAEGWNPGLQDSTPFHATDPEGFLIAEHKGKPVGCISCVTYGDTFAFVGFYIVVPEHRGKGYGLALWQAAMARGGSRVTGLDGVVAQQANYRKSGFDLAFNNARYEFQGSPTPSEKLTPLTEIPFDDLVHFDARYFPVPRPVFLRNWISMPQTFAYAARRNGRLTGYGLIRPCRVGYKIGPLFADAPDTAESLFLSLAAHANGAPVYLDVPKANPAAVTLAEHFGMKETFQTARMYLNGAPHFDLNGVFGITTFELG